MVITHIPTLFPFFTILTASNPWSTRNVSTLLTPKVSLTTGTGIHIINSSSTDPSALAPLNINSHPSFSPLVMLFYFMAQKKFRTPHNPPLRSHGTLLTYKPVPPFSLFFKVSLRDACWPS
ncbi:hypothetical protein BJ741DRAFT_244423 [Chytriomyces cf. hyalinus JEL632]|nr:hypothetical protein BJ741DRAFT_244423 [Chytriomyces cf. hyalinus JEL632]